MKSSYGNNMMLFTSFWDQHETFRLLPLTEDCPFTEVIYNRSVSILVVISKNKKNNFQYVAKLDPNGEPIRTTKPKANGKAYQEQRVLVELLQEYYITEKAEQIEFIKSFAVNATTFDFEKFLRDIEDEHAQGIMQVEKQPLVDKNGAPLKVIK